MKLYFYHDRLVHAQRNAAGKDYTPAYLPAILKNLGFTAQELLSDQLDTLQSGDALLLGAETLNEKQLTQLQHAYARGCRILAFGAQGAGLFPQTQTVFRSEDLYETAGYFRFADSQEPLPVLQHFDAVSQGEVLGTVEAKDGNRHPAFVRCGENLYYFGFDLPATLLYAADGSPTLIPKNGFPIPVGRVPDGCVLEPEYDRDIAFGDSYLRRVEDILTNWGFPRIYALPVQNGQVCDLTVFFAGDDDAASRENNFVAAEFMHSRNLPYHINIMPSDTEGHFVVDREDIAYLHSLGCETALHYNFVIFPYSLEGHRLQKALYEKTFGEPGGGPVNHCVVQNGTAPERYRMEAEVGVRSENNRLQNKLDPNDINAFNLTGYAFGHAFPRFVLADAAHGNRELDLCEIPCSYYEPRIYQELPEEYAQIEAYLNEGYAYGRTQQFFHHPHYISGKAGFDPIPARRSVDHVKAHVEKMGWNVWFCAPDMLGQWWHDRAECTIQVVDAACFEINNTTAKPLTVVLPEGAVTACADGMECAVVCKIVGGRQLKLINVKPGISRISICS